MSENMTVCPDCGEPFETSRSEEMGSGVVQGLEQHCQDCDRHIRVSIINYPPSEYEVIGPALDDESCSIGNCGSDAVIRTQRIGESVFGRCVDHQHAHHVVAAQFSNQM